MLLTFAIPVHNDADALKKTLTSIKHSIVLSRSDLEVIVSDNHSDDNPFENTKDILRDLPNFRYRRQPENVGFSRNVQTLANLARGEYIWFLGAGDTLVAEFIETVLDYISEMKPDFGTVGGRFNFQTKHPKVNYAELFTLGNSTSPNSSQFFNHAISLNIIRTDIVRGLNIGKHPKNLQRDLHPLEPVSPAELWETETNYWPHLECICQVAEKGGSLTWFEFHRPAVLLNMNKNGTWDKGLSAVKIFVQWAEIVRRTQVVLPWSHWVRQQSKDLHGPHLLRFVFAVRKDRSVDPDDAISQLSRLKIGILIRVSAHIILRLPLPVVRYLVRLRGLYLCLLQKKLWQKNL